MHTLTIKSGRDKQGVSEGYTTLTLQSGQLYAIVGNTGSGKSRLIKDIEQLAQGDTVTNRTVLLDDKIVSKAERMEWSSKVVAHLCQNMRFVLDITVEEFLQLHANCREKTIEIEQVVEMANNITPEPITLQANLNLLSGGQTRALMIADIAMICDSPIVLIDEIENAGIDKEKALQLLIGKEKLVLVVTHDVHTALMASTRVVMRNGAVKDVIHRSEGEIELYEALSAAYKEQKILQNQLRQGGILG